MPEFIFIEFWRLNVQPFRHARVSVGSNMAESGGSSKFSPNAGRFVASLLALQELELRLRGPD